VARVRVGDQTALKTAEPNASGSGSDAPPRRQTPQEEYRARLLVFNDAGNPLSGSGFGWLFPETTAWQGDDRVGLGPAAFYRAIDREDLASSYVTGNFLRYGLLGGGALVFVAGGVVTLYGLTLDTQTEPLRTISIYGGIITLLLGAGATSAGALYNPHPTSHSDRKRMTREHNDQLKKELGVVGALPHTRPRVAFGPSLDDDVE
jgi:hypothetical protein